MQISLYVFPFFKWWCWIKTYISKNLVAHYVKYDVNLFALHIKKIETSHQGRTCGKICKRSLHFWEFFQIGQQKIRFMSPLNRNNILVKKGNLCKYCMSINCLWPETFLTGRSETWNHHFFVWTWCCLDGIVMIILSFFLLTIFPLVKVLWITSRCHLMFQWSKYGLSYWWVEHMSHDLGTVTIFRLLGLGL